VCKLPLARGAQLALLVGIAMTDVELDVVAGVVRFFRVGHLAICRFRAACSW